MIEKSDDSGVVITVRACHPRVLGPIPRIGD